MDNTSMVSKNVEEMDFFAVFAEMFIKIAKVKGIPLEDLLDVFYEGALDYSNHRAVQLKFHNALLKNREQ